MEVSSIHAIGPVAAPSESPVDPQQRAERIALVRAARVLNEAQSFGPTSEVTFSLDRATHKPILRIIDRETKEVLSQLPPEYVLRMAAQVA